MQDAQKAKDGATRKNGSDRVVYCKDCKWYYYSAITMYSNSDAVCRCPNNMYRDDCWDAQYTRPFRSPSEINKHNNCPSYAPKWWRRIWRRR